MSQSTPLKLLTDRSIEAALKLDWPTSIALNQQILSFDPHDIPTLNRLAKAYKEIGSFDTAVATYQQVLCLDRFNIIAQKNLHQLSLNHQISPLPCGDRTLNTDFVEEPGKTATFSLVRLGDSQLLGSLQSGQIVQLLPKKHTVYVVTGDGHHIGALTDDVAYSLKHFIEAGNTYQTTIKNCNPQAITVFIRETFRSENLKNTPTF